MHTTYLSITLNLLSNAVAHSFPLLIPCLDCEGNLEVGYGLYHTSEVDYEEPDLSGAVEGVDYLIAYGASDDEEEEPQT